MQSGKDIEDSLDLTNTDFNRVSSMDDFFDIDSKINKDKDTTEKKIPYRIILNSYDEVGRKSNSDTR